MITQHAIQRASDRLRGHFGSLSLDRVGKACAGAIYHPQTEPLVLYPQAEENQQQIATPFLHKMKNTICGYLVLDKERRHPNIVIAKTWIEPGSWQLQKAQPSPWPSWYVAFRTDIENTSIDNHKIDQTKGPR